MKDKEIHKQGYWVHILPLAAHNNWGFEILKKLKKSWRSELNAFDFSNPQDARKEAIVQLKIILKD